MRKDSRFVLPGPILGHARRPKTRIATGRHLTDSRHVAAGEDS